MGKGSKLILGVKKSSQENKIIYKLREFYYGLLNSISTQKVIEFCGLDYLIKKL